MEETTYMSIMRVAVIAVLVCVGSHVGYAETRPDFSGNWVLKQGEKQAAGPAPIQTPDHGSMAARSRFKRGHS